MGNIDLHMHSTYSDGSMTPNELIEMAGTLGLSSIALTDHFTVEGLHNITVKNDVEVIPGVEYTAQILDTNVDIIGLFVDIYNPALMQFKDKIYAGNERYAQRVVNKVLEENGVAKEGYLQYITANNLPFARFTLSRYFIQLGVAADYADFGARIMNNVIYPRLKEECVDYKEVIGVIKACGGTVIWAHPFQIPDIGKRHVAKVWELLDLLIPAGLEGVEAFHSAQTMRQAAFLQECATEHNLLVSCGSDYHGENRKTVKMGEMCRGAVRCNSTYLDNIKEYRKRG